MTLKLSENVRVRFAPSPTGDLHLGGVRTALYNWLFAKHNKGTFLLRIEDSDIERSTIEATNLIIEGMNWLGLEPDEEIIFQSNRQERHQKILQQLVDEGKAYYCDCSVEMLAEKREKALKNGEKPKYDGRCRERHLRPEGNALRFRSPDDGQTVFNDIIRGEVVFDNSELDDLIICRSNNTPTYNFLVVVDDYDLGITHVIRGEDHINNTPRQIQLYKALGLIPPTFAHLPSVLGPDKARLSKRHGATSILQYRDQGFLPDALINYIARLGWGHGDQEIFSKEELVEFFQLEQVNRSAAVFDVEKLLWVNSQHIMNTPVIELTDSLQPFIIKQNYSVPTNYPIKTIVELFRERAHTLQELAEKARFIFEEPENYDPKGAKKFLRPIMIEPFIELLDSFQKLYKFDKHSTYEIIENFLQKKSWKLGKIAQPLRVAITGVTASPGIFEVLEAVGKEAVCLRIERAIEFMNVRKEQQLHQKN